MWCTPAIPWSGDYISLGRSPHTWHTLPDPFRCRRKETQISFHHQDPFAFVGPIWSPPRVYVCFGYADLVLRVSSRPVPPRRWQTWIDRPRIYAQWSKVSPVVIELTCNFCNCEGFCTEEEYLFGNIWIFVSLCLLFSSFFCSFFRISWIERYLHGYAHGFHPCKVWGHIFWDGWRCLFIGGNKEKIIWHLIMVIKPNWHVNFDVKVLERC